MVCTERIEKVVCIPVNTVKVEGKLVIPKQSEGLVLFAHGSGSSQHSPRNNQVASALQANGLGTLLIDLLSEKEDTDYEHRFDMERLAQRLILITDWLRTYSETVDLKIGYFGASTGSAAALRAAAHLGKEIAAIVSRGGRVDLADRYIPKVEVPTLLIVGEYDHGVLEMNQIVYSKLNCCKELKIVPKATHLFEEEGALEQVARWSANWFRRYLS